MNDLSIARRYARALYDEGRTAGMAEIDTDVDFIRASFVESPALRRMFESPVVPRHKKVTVVRELFAERIRPVTMRFLEMMIAKNREDVFPQIVAAYQELRDKERGIVEATARVASELDENAREQMRLRLEKMTGKKVRLVVKREPELLGGAVVRIGDTVYDGSVRNKLVSLQEQMEHGSFSMN